MKRILRVLGLVVFATICGGAVGAQSAAPPANKGVPVAQFKALVEATWQRDLKASPLTATYYGDTRFNDRWPDVSAAAYENNLATDKRALAELNRINRARLPTAEQLNYDLFKRELNSRITEAAFKPWSYAMTMREGPQTANEVAEIMPFVTVADYETWLKRLRALPAYLLQYEELLRTAAKEGRTQPRGLMQRALPILESQASATADSSPFMSRFARIPNTIIKADADRLRASATEVIGKQVIPAYQRFAAFFREDYLPKCRESVGVWDTPDGLAYYNNRAYDHTTTTLTPNEIHEIGLKEVARIHTEMQQVMDRVKFKGTRQEFFQFLRTDPQFYFTDADDLFRAYVYTTKMIEPELPKLFGKLYRTPVGVKVIPATSAPNTTTAYYSGPSMDGKRAGYFYANLYRPEVRPKYEIEVLTAHEAIPGHHLQIALAQEQGELPKFRRFAGYTAYIEGWALYSERLGFELGLYKNPYSHFGMLTYDMWRAVRLVVDTGIHVKKWSRQQAIDYFKDNAAKTEADIINEIDRYIGWPGQALAYKIGQLRILELRARAEKALGDKFDIRAFHDMLLESGAIPLDVLETRVNDWIKRPRP
jgi:prolyl oligopeptidase